MAYSPELLAAPRTSRYRIISLLGRGATSLVFKAFDTEKSFNVALKSVRFPEYEDIFRIKQEFRFFRDFYHQNLVSLYDLQVDRDVCFYTMELIEGIDFVSFIQSQPSAVRPCLGQLAAELAALHEAGWLHRDLKPNNILVEPDGRTVLLDFGLSLATQSDDSIVTEARLFAGTPGYMAPEQLVGEAPSEATDLYAVGVVLYQALTGHPPYPRVAPVALYELQRSPPAMPEAADNEDLAALALALLSFEPQDRPKLDEVTRLARVSPARGTAQHDRYSHPFVGRDAELTQLRDAFARSRVGRSVAVLVSGTSGVGKTTLIGHFLAEAHRDFAALVLRSRCHHQESVRFNAVDGLIDMLSRYLMQESEERLAQLTPDLLPALVTMFPVLGRVPFSSDAFGRDEIPRDPQTLVQQALEALRDLLRRLAAVRPLILWIDDLQWSDAGSLPILRDIAAMGRDRKLLPIFSYRTEDLQPGAVAGALEHDAALPSEIEVERLLVPPLDEPAIASLVRSFAGDDTPTDPAWVREVIRQSSGLPFFVVEFAAAQRLALDADGISSLTAAGMLSQRIETLATSQRITLEVVSVAGAPIAEDAVIRITTSEQASGREIYHLLNQRLLRKTTAYGRPALETYHDRIRMADIDALPPDARRRRHRAIADELAGADEQDHPRLVEHYLGAGEPEIGAENAILAARVARGRLAFDQAVEFFLLAARLRDPKHEESQLTLELADALADAGRSAEAADLFLQAARGCQSDRRTAMTYEARAAQQLLYSGRLAEGRDVYRRLFTGLNIAFPDSVRAARWLSIANRLALAVRRNRLRPRPPRNGTATALQRIDTLWAASKGLMMLDYIVGDAIFTCFMREAASLGDGSRVMRAMAVESSVMANVGRRWSLRRSETLLRRACDIAGESKDPYDRVVLRTCQSGAAWFRGRWQEAAELAAEAIALHRRDCVRYDFEVPIALGYRVSAVVMQGALGQAKAETQAAIEDAQRRGDRYVTGLFRSGYSTYIAIADDDPERVIADSATLLHEVPQDRFTSVHWSYFNATVNALVYANRPWDAWSVVRRQWPMIEAAGFLGLGCIGAHLREIRSRAALQAAAAGKPPPALREWTRDRLLRLVESDASRIARTGSLSHAHATAAAIRSGLAALDRSPDRRRVMLAAACTGFAEAGMMLHRTAAELQLALLDPDGDAGGDAARQAMSREGVRRPERMAAFLMFA